MKLFFPNGEHPQVLIAQGEQRLGSGAGMNITLSLPGIADAHAEFHCDGDSLSVRALDGVVSVNDTPLIAGKQMPLAAGDSIAFGPVQARVMGMASAQAATQPANSLPEPPPSMDDNGATRVRMAVPRFVLRGVSGVAFGKTFPVMTQQVIGRQEDCDIPLSSKEISRRHALVRPTPIGLHVEDLGSSNGTFINGKRVQEGLLKPGEELRLDNIRFLLVAPGAEIPTASRLAKENEPAPEKGGLPIGWIITTLAALAAAGAAAYYLL